MYAIAGLIGTGTEDDPYIADVTGTFGPCVIPVNTDGSLKNNWCVINLREPDKAVGAGLIKLDSKDPQLQSKLDSANIVADVTSKTDQVIADEIGKQLDSNFEAKIIIAAQLL